MKIVSKILLVLVAFIFILSMTANVFAVDSNIVINSGGDDNTNAVQDQTSNSEGTTTLEVVEDNICTIEIEDLATFEKRITNFNETEKSVTLTLTLTNNKTAEQTPRDVEIFFVIDNSSSMTENYIGGQTRKQSVLDSANSLVEKLFEARSNIQVGVVGFSSLDTSKGETEGTINDADLRLGLSSSVDEVKSAISNLSVLEVGPRTNIEAGLTLADDNFSDKENVERYIVLLTDGVPNNATDGTFGQYSDNVINRTRTKLEEIENSGTKIIGAMINLDSEEVEPTTHKTYRALSEEVFGTEENPNIDTYFYIPDSEIEDTIVNDIFDNIVDTTDNTLRNITITDYFPQEIIDNFDFEYVASPNVGTVSQTINTENNSITWNIELLSEGETATLSYKLTLKDDYDKEIVGQIIKTNTHVDITGENNGNTLTETSEDSPTIRVQYDEPVITPDNTIANGIIPQTGNNSTLWFAPIITILAIIIIARMIYLKNSSEK